MSASQPIRWTIKDSYIEIKLLSGSVLFNEGFVILCQEKIDSFLADSTRVELYPRPREEGSDYINASYLAVRIRPSLRGILSQIFLSILFRIYCKHVFSYLQFHKIPGLYLVNFSKVNHHLCIILRVSL